MSKPDYDVTLEQENFAAEATQQGLMVDYHYTNKFMHGKKCPAVRVPTVHAFATRIRGVQWEQISKTEFAIYCPY